MAQGELQIKLDFLFSKIKKIENKIKFKEEIDIEMELNTINIIAYSIQKAISSRHRKNQGE
ncbi:hypothetical protein [Olleya sp. HaHaR_3_96]|uniref:hypothetical protein n=1 Tax=Olleya sp. HaHaR_3_96 TaxID=2745560 RepID=UPI001C4FE4DF|nr:hypothetical protein [Olleya sp. HaHaR_3_96]QXP58271.1 hypothetical protein H0I26_10085 [Olleya sp. HaHaR_3_96]